MSLLFISGVVSLHVVGRRNVHILTILVHARQICKLLGRTQAAHVAVLVRRELAVRLVRGIVVLLTLAVQRRLHLSHLNWLSVGKPVVHRARVGGHLGAFLLIKLRGVGRLIIQLLVLVGGVDPTSFVHQMRRFLLSGILILQFGGLLNDFREHHGRVRLFFNVFFDDRFQRSLMKKCFVLLVLRLVL